VPDRLHADKRCRQIIGVKVVDGEIPFVREAAPAGGKSHRELGVLPTGGGKSLIESASLE